MPFAATGMALEIITLSQTQKDKYHTISLKCGIKKNYTNVLIYKTQTDSQNSKTNYWSPKVGVRDRLGLWD